jgi:histidine triad (HIT) family protein
MMELSGEKPCIFCKMARGRLQPVIITEDKDIMAIMDLYPASEGHILVFPKRHIENIYALSPDLGSGIMGHAIEIANAIKKRLNPAGINLIQSNEDAAGQTISHLHLHIVPRYKNDSVVLQFGHGNTPGDTGGLELIAQGIRSLLIQSSIG